MFQVSHLKHGLLHMPNGKSVKNISDYKLEMVKLKNNPTWRIENPEVLHTHHDETQTTCQNADIPINWYQSASIF